MWEIKLNHGWYFINLMLCKMKRKVVRNIGGENHKWWYQCCNHVCGAPDHKHDCNIDITCDFQHLYGYTCLVRNRVGGHLLVHLEQPISFSIVIGKTFCQCIALLWEGCQSSAQRACYHPKLSWCHISQISSYQTSGYPFISVVM